MGGFSGRMLRFDRKEDVDRRETGVIGGVEGEGSWLSLRGSVGVVGGGRFVGIGWSGVGSDSGMVSSVSLVALEGSGSIADGASGSLEVGDTAGSLLLDNVCNEGYGSSDGPGWTNSENSGLAAGSIGLTGENGSVSDNDCRDDALGNGGGF
jgi:hypothetical protein